MRCTGTVPANESGSTRLEVIARDADGVSATDLFTVTFAAANAVRVGIAAAAASIGPHDTLGGLGLTPFSS